MKILTKNKIIEAFHFPFTEALIFSILVWCTWGLAEAFYWNRIALLIDPNTQRAESYIYVYAFFIYVAVAVFFASLLYVGMRIILATFHLHNTRTFRAVTLTVTFGLFLVAALFHCFLHLSLQSSLTQSMLYALYALFGIFSIAVLVLLYRWASGDDFRIRRSGTMMLSIFVISLVLTFVPFPIFSTESRSKQTEQAKHSYRRLMAYQYLSPLLEP